MTTRVDRLYAVAHLDHKLHYCSPLYTLRLPHPKSLQKRYDLVSYLSRDSDGLDGERMTIRVDCPYAVAHLDKC